jgi:hypothetical protein
MFEKYEVVKLKEDISSENLRAGTLGTVLMVFDEPGLPKAYEVEFFAEGTTTLAVLTVKEKAIERA